MSVKIELKRSSVPGRVPTTSSLNLGEIALNTFDGKAYIKKDNGTASIIQLGSIFPYTGSAAISGSLTITGPLLANLTNQSQPYFVSYNTASGQFFYANTGSFFAASASYATTSSYALTASYIQAAGIVGLNLSQISTGSITASVDVNANNLFLIKSGSTNYLNIASDSSTTVYSNLFIVKNFTTQQPVLTVSQSIIQVTTQSFNPSGTTTAGSIWFTSSSMYIGLG